MSHPVDVHVGKRIRQRRWLVNMTQQQLGEQIGIKFQQVQKYETGANRVSASRLWQIASALQVPVSFFFEGLSAGGEVSTAAAQDPVQDKEAMNLVRAYYKIPERQRCRLLELARSMGDAPASSAAPLPA